ncbi:DEAD/DEAH box helicase [Thalassiella azotivora]
MPHHDDLDPVTVATSRWRDELVAAAGRDALVDFRDLETGTLDLATAHPSGLAQFLAGRPTRLSSLFREPGALSAARQRARAIRLSAARLADQHGVGGSYLASGMVSWRLPDGGRVQAPALLRPLTLRSRGVGQTDDDLDLGWEVRANPALLRLLARHGVPVDPDLLVDLATDAHGFDPRPVLDELRDVAGHLDGFTVTERTVVGIFVDVVPAMLADLDRLAAVMADHPVVRDLARVVVETAERRDAQPREQPETDPDADPDPDDGVADDGAPDDDVDHDVSPAAASDGASADASGRTSDGDASDGDTGAADEADGPSSGRAAPSLPDPHAIADAGLPAAPRVVPAQVLELDPDQRRAVAAVEAGHSLVVSAPPGTGATRLVSQVVVSQAARGRRTLLVCAQRAELAAVADTLADVGLADLLRDPGALLDRHAGTDPVDDTDADRAAADGARALAELDALGRERAALHEEVQPWGVTVSQALHALARLSSGPRAPRTTVRLDRQATGRLAGRERDEVATVLREVADLGEFDARTEDSPWHRARLAGREQAQDALGAARRLAEETLPALRAQMEQTAAAVGLAGARSLADWGRQLDLLVAVRATLDTFTPGVYERSVAEMVAATAAPSWREAQGVRMSTMERRRWRKQAKDLLRPGAAPGDLHQALRRAQDERSEWQRMSTGGGWPQVPVGLTATDALYHAVRADVLLLDGVLADGGLADVSLPELEQRLTRLAVEDDVTRSLADRVETTTRLRELGLDPLLADLLHRRVPPARVADELELCWWASVLEHALVDQRVAPGGGVDGTRYHREARTAHEAAAAVVRDVERAKAEPSCTLTSPLSLPSHVPDRQRFDLVVVAGAHSCAVAEGALAMARGTQVLVVGDPDGLPPAGLDLAPEDGPEGTERPGPRESVLRLAAAVLPRLRLGHQHRQSAQVCRLASRPPAWTVPAPDGGVRLALVADGTGPLDAEGGVQSVDAEVRRVVGLVLQHARTHPGRSLAVLTVTRQHARRVADAVRAELPEHPDVAGWFTRPTAEPFVVTDLPRSEDAVRDAVILSVGFGLTPRGRVIHRFGPLDEDGGEQGLNVAVTRARWSTTVVSCLRAEDLDPQRTRTPGAQALRALLEAAARPDAPAHVLGGRKLDALLDDLAKRLHDKGLHVEPGDGRAGWPDLAVHLPTVEVGGSGSSQASSQGPGAASGAGTSGEPGSAVAVLTDARWRPRAGGTVADLVADDLAVAEHLRRFGWRVVPVSSLDLFTDADAVVDAVLAAVGGR